eukprot:1968182-Amphidinium_carterae.3
MLNTRSLTTAFKQFCENNGLSKILTKFIEPDGTIKPQYVTVDNGLESVRQTTRSQWASTFGTVLTMTSWPTVVRSQCTWRQTTTTSSTIDYVDNAEYIDIFDIDYVLTSLHNVDNGAQPQKSDGLRQSDNVTIALALAADTTATIAIGSSSHNGQSVTIDRSNSTSLSHFTFWLEWPFKET